MPSGSKQAKANRYQTILVDIFQNHYSSKHKWFDFQRDEIEQVAAKLKITLPKNIGDVVYSQRYRAEWPEQIKSAIPNGHDWIILPAGRGRYRFKLIKGNSRILPRSNAAIIKVPDTTPEIIGKYARSQEQAVLARIRYNRLLDTFLGITAYSLQNHLRTAVQDMGQIEIDELYVGINREGQQFIIPVQAKGGSDQLSIIQTIQDIACCREKFSPLTCRPVSTQLLEDGVIVMFELREQEEGIPVVTEERHYRLVPYDEISPSDLEKYKMK